MKCMISDCIGNIEHVIENRIIVNRFRERIRLWALRSRQCKEIIMFQVSLSELPQKCIRES